MPPREQIRRRRDADGERMRRHVPAVGEQRHGSEDRASRDLDDHHRDGEADDEPGSALVARMPRAEEHVLVRPAIEGVRVHLSAP